MGSKFNVRASAIGSYLLCDYRAALDKAVLEGSIPSPVQPEGAKPYADLGSLIHARTQQLVKAFAPHEITLDPAHLASAAVLFADQAAALAQVESAAALAAAHMPAALAPWYSEFSYRDSASKITGHIDFVSHDRKTIIDLKTTSRKPDHNRMKADHFAQLIAYSLMVPTAERAMVLYVDSMKSQWVMMTEPIDLTSQEVKDYAASLRQYALKLRSKSIFGTAMPHLGAHCQSTFCPYTSVCRDKLIPPAGVPVETVSRAPKAPEGL